MSGLSGTRKCHVIKEESEEFEFFLKVDEARKGQIITSVTKGGPAYRAGLKDGDRIVEINGNNVEAKDHNQIVGLIRECVSSNEITFIVIDPTKDPNVKSKPASNKKSSTDTNSKPRICKIKKKNNSFGFFLEAQGESNPGHFIKKVTAGGASDGTGLLEGDRIIAVGKTNVENEKHTQVVNLIKKSGNKCTLLVIDEEMYKDLKERDIPITEKLAKGGSVSSRKSSSSSGQKSVKSTKQSAKSKPAKTSVKPKAGDDLHGKVRVVHVLKHPDKGYGFFLRAKKNAEGEFIGDIEENGSADICGLQNDDRLMAVNGKSIIGMSHTEVIGAIKSKQFQVVFVVMDESAMKQFKDKDSFPSKEDIVHSHDNIIRSLKLDKSSSGYGMSLKMDKGHPFHIVSDVEKDGVADKTGLKDGEVVIAVEEMSVLKDTHEECVQKIKDAGDSVRLLVGDRKSAEFVHKCGVAITMDFITEWPTEEERSVPSFGKSPVVEKEEEIKESPKPVVKAAAAVVVAAEIVDQSELGHKARTCRIVKEDGGFGFFLKDEDGHYLINVEEQGPAFRAGVLEYDRIIEINGVNVEDVTHNDVVNEIRSSGKEVTFLVVNKEEDKHIKAKAIAVTAAVAAIKNDDDELADEHRPRVCHLTRTSTGYGFHLSGESNREGQFIKEIVPGGAGDISGLREGDRVIEVNDFNVINESHETIVKKVTEKKDEVTFMVIDNEGEDYYKKRGVAIVSTLIAAKVIHEIREERKEEAMMNENASVSGGSVSSSIIETEATVHKEDEKEENKLEDTVKVVAAAAIIHEVVQEKEDVIDEETKQEIVEEVIDLVTKEVSEDKKEEREEENRLENAGTDEEEVQEEGGLERAEKAAIAIVAVAVANEIIEDKNEDAKSDTSEEQDRPQSPILDVPPPAHSESEKEVVSETVKEIADEILENHQEDVVDVVEEILQEDTDLRDVVENHIEEKQEETEEEREKKVFSAMLANEIVKRIDEKVEDIQENDSQKISDDEKEDKRVDENVEEPEFVASPAAIAAAIVRAETPDDSRKSSMSDVGEEPPKSVVVKEVAPKPAEPSLPKPLSTILMTEKEPPKLKHVEEKKNQPFTWGQHSLKPVNRSVATPKPITLPTSPNDDEEAVPVKSTVASMRAAFEQNQRQKQRENIANEIQGELAELSKQKGEANKRIQMFGGSAKMSKPNGHVKPKKQTSWTGEGMSIQIIES